MNNSTVHFEIRRDAVQKYFYWSACIAALFLGLCLFGFGIILGIVYCFTLGPWLARKQAQALQYRLEGRTLHIEQGVIFLKRKAIPLERITDLALTQGPLLRMLGLWRLDIQTAGTGQQMAEGYLYGLVNPDETRALLLERRNLNSQ